MLVLTSDTFEWVIFVKHQMRNFSAISWREHWLMDWFMFSTNFNSISAISRLEPIFLMRASYILWNDNDDVYVVLDHHASLILIVIAHWNLRLQVDMSDTLSWFQGNQSAFTP